MRAGSGGLFLRRVSAHVAPTNFCYLFFFDDRVGTGQMHDASVLRVSSVRQPENASLLARLSPSTCRRRWLSICSVWIDMP